jgi:hypothetical protein
MYEITYIDNEDQIRVFKICATKYEIMLNIGELDNLDSVTVKFINE